jgi:hypothetical protein
VIVAACDDDRDCCNERRENEGQRKLGPVQWRAVVPTGLTVEHRRVQDSSNSDSNLSREIVLSKVPNFPSPLPSSFLSSILTPLR